MSCTVPHLLLPADYTTNMYDDAFIIMGVIPALLSLGVLMLLTMNMPGQDMKSFMLQNAFALFSFGVSSLILARDSDDCGYSEFVAVLQLLGFFYIIRLFQATWSKLLAKSIVGNTLGFIAGIVLGLFDLLWVVPSVIGEQSYPIILLCLTIGTLIAGAYYTLAKRPSRDTKNGTVSIFVNLVSTILFIASLMYYEDSGDQTYLWFVTSGVYITLVSLHLIFSDLLVTEGSTGKSACGLTYITTGNAVSATPKTAAVPKATATTCEVQVL